MNVGARPVGAEVRIAASFALSGSDACAGMDEVGRGALAGPLVAAAVVLPHQSRLPADMTLTDSKQLTAAERERLDGWIRRHADMIAVQTIGVAAINQLGIGWANRSVFGRLMAHLGTRRYLVDGNLRLHGLAPRGARIVCRCDGDQLEPAIAAASIIAKVHRDRLMQSLDRAYPGYGWAHNAGYGTSEHRAAVRALGPCEHHRTLFLRRVMDKGKD
jgi:ribonuclease HII